MTFTLSWTPQRASVAPSPPLQGGSVIWSLVHATYPALRGGYVELWGADPKGGMEPGKGRDVWAQYATSVQGIVGLLEQAVDTM